MLASGLTIKLLHFRICMFLQQAYSCISETGCRTKPKTMCETRDLGALEDLPFSFYSIDLRRNIFHSALSRPRFLIFSPVEAIFFRRCLCPYLTADGGICLVRDNPAVLLGYFLETNTPRLQNMAAGSKQESAQASV